MSAPEERLRALGLDRSPAARRLRARIPRPAVGALTATEPRPSAEPHPGAAVPSAPYAVEEATTPYRPERPRVAGPARRGRAGRPGALWSGTVRPEEHTEGRTRVAGRVSGTVAWPERDPEDTLTPPAARRRPAEPPRAEPPPGTTASPSRFPTTTTGAPESGPWRERVTRSTGSTGSASPTGPAAGPGDGSSHRQPPEEPWEASEEPAKTSDASPSAEGDGGGEVDTAGRHRRRPARPPSGYTELDPEEPVSALDRVAHSWGANTSLSRRSVVTLAVLGLLAIAAAVLLLRERPNDVVDPELVTQAAPADEEGDGAPADGGDGAGDADGGSAEADPEPDADVVVHVGGEVSDPGLYTMPAGSRVADAVEEAGGPLPEADLDLLNLARPLTDGEHLLVGLPQPEGSGGGPSGAGGGAGGEGQPVNINLADQAELETLPGIGEAKAQAILSHRESLGGSFADVDDLLGVDGIAEKSLQTLEPHVTVG
ncbi:hypothetical protein GCM10027590_18740 [Nocardiopsis nanhaiensis]